MQARYTTYGYFQQKMKERYETYGTGIQFPEMIRLMDKRGQLLTEKPENPETIGVDPGMSDQAFNQFIDRIVITAYPDEWGNNRRVNETDIIPQRNDIFTIRHPRYTSLLLHAHNYYEIDYVSSGHCTFFFNGTSRELNKGELVIIAPGMKHDIQILDNETLVLCGMIRKSTFDVSFFPLLSSDNLLASFFRSTLTDKSRENYLLFFTGNRGQVNLMLRFCLLESVHMTEFTSIRCISWMNILFSDLLINYSQTIQFYDYAMGTDFSLILQYIQHNYQSLTLPELAKFFHYSEPYLSTLIRQNTGSTFTELVRHLRFQEAIKYLTSTTLKVSEIAAKIGYHSADHFSRSFRSVYHMSPQQYQKEYQIKDKFIPFQTE